LIPTGARQPADDAVAYADVLAAMVLRRVFLSVSVVLAAIVAVIGYAWFNIRDARHEIEAQQDEIAQLQSRLRAEIASTREEMEVMKDAMQQDVRLASGLVQGAQQYQSVMAGQLISMARTERTMQASTSFSDLVRERADAKMVALEQRDSVRRLQVESDRDSLRAFRTGLVGTVNGTLREAIEANRRVLHRWGQVVEEQQETPILDSGFWFSFDDIDDRSSSINKTQLLYTSLGGRRHVPGFPGKIFLADTVSVNFNGISYRFFVVDRRRDRGLIPFTHTDRLIVRLERVLADTLRVRLVQAAGK
jgi:hypothetical protein